MLKKVLRDYGLLDQVLDVQYLEIYDGVFGRVNEKALDNDASGASNNKTRWSLLEESYFGTMSGRCSSLI